MGFLSFLFNSNHPSNTNTTAAAPVSSVSATGFSSAPSGNANWFNGIGNTPITSNGPVKVYSPRGSELILSDSNLLASGGEGSVYAMPQKPDILIKLYKPEILNNPEKLNDLRSRIKAMIELSPQIRVPGLAWPRMEVCDAQKKVIGFAMNNCTGKSLLALSSIAAVRKNFPGWDRRQLVVAATDFVEKLQFLAANKVLVNDFNPANFLVDAQGHVSFIDCDSFQLTDRRGTCHITRTFFPSHTAPELLQDKSKLARPRNIHHVEFGAALIVFNILMCGLHPYSYYDPARGIGCGTPDENLKNGRCPLGVGAGCMFPQGPWYNLWSYFTGDLKASFIRTFKDGHADPSQRTTLEQLGRDLQKLSFEMQRMPARCELEPAAPKPRGDRQATASGEKVKIF